jgi:ABC-2 type transport system permease protein
MTTITTTAGAGADTADTTGAAGHTRPATGRLSALSTLARRRLALTARTPREILVPLMAPLLFAVIVAPALADTFGATPGGIDYMTFVAVSTIGLLIPLNSMTAGLGVIVDRLGGARRDLLAAPIPRSLIVVGNLVVALALSGLQVTVLIGAAALRGAEYELEATGVAWFVAAVVAFAVAMYGVAEVLANRIPTQEEYIGALPPVAIVPFFVAGGLFPISALPAGLTFIGKLLPLTHVIALTRYGIVDRTGAGLHDIWGMDDPTAMAALSLGAVALFAVAFTALSIRVFRRAAVS